MGHEPAGLLHPLLLVRSRRFVIVRRHSQLAASAQYRAAVANVRDVQPGTEDEARGSSTPSLEYFAAIAIAEWFMSLGRGTEWCPRKLTFGAGCGRRSNKCRVRLTYGLPESAHVTAGAGLPRRGSHRKNSTKQLDRDKHNVGIKAGFRAFPTIPILSSLNNKKSASAARELRDT